MNLEYLIVALLLNAAALVIVNVFGLLWNRSRLAGAYNSNFSFPMSFLCNLALLPLHLLIDVLILQAVLG